MWLPEALLAWYTVLLSGPTQQPAGQRHHDVSCLCCAAVQQPEVAEGQKWFKAPSLATQPGTKRRRALSFDPRGKWQQVWAARTSVLQSLLQRRIRSCTNALHAQAVCCTACICMPLCCAQLCCSGLACMHARLPCLADLLATGFAGYCCCQSIICTTGCRPIGIQHC